MAHRDNTWSTSKECADFQQIIPDHECPEEGECTHPGAFYAFVTEEDGGVTVASGTHHASVMMVIDSVIQMLDRMFLDAKPDGMPAMVAWTQGREALKNACERTAPPGEISFDIMQFMNSLTNGETDE